MRLVFKGKTDMAEMKCLLVEYLQDEFTKEKFRAIWNDVNNFQVILYGEGYGAYIKKGKEDYIPDGVGFVLFDVRIGHIWLQRVDVEDIAQKLGIKVVPIIGGGTLIDMVEFCREGFKSEWGDFMAEGIVARPKVEMLDRLGERIITKVKYRDFKR